MSPRHRRTDRPAASAGLSGLLAAGSLAMVLGLAGCAASPPPETPAEAAARTAPTPPLAAEEPAAAEPSDTARAGETSQGSDPGADAAASSDAGKDTARADSESARSDHVIVIDRGTGGSEPSLWEAAVAERKRRATAKKAVASVTNDNLHEYQDAELTFAQPKDAAAQGEGETDAEAADGAGEGATTEEGTESGEAAADASTAFHGEQYWRNRVLDVRTRLHDAADRIDELEERVATLRRQFYAEDDPYVRDGQIKPAWDRALDRLSHTHREVDRLRTELADTLDEGHREGALPGWLREGIDLEPTFDDSQEPSRRDGDLKIYEPTEPDTIDPEDTTSPDASGTEPPPASPSANPPTHP